MAEVVFDRITGLNKIYMSILKNHEILSNIDLETKHLNINEVN